MLTKAPAIITSPRDLDAMGPLALDIFKAKYAQHQNETWEECAERVSKTILMEAFPYIRDRKFLPGGRYIYATGRELGQYQNCMLYRAEDSREGWSEHLRKNTMALMTGAGCGTVYSRVRYEGAPISKTGGKATGPVSLMQMTNEAGRHIMQGGSRRSALWAGLHWWHPDVFKFVRIKDWPQWLRDRKVTDPNCHAPLDGTNISVILDTEFFDALETPAHPKHQIAHDIYWLVVHQMMSTAEPGFSVDYNKDEECLRNACTEVTSADDSDVCNLGSINLARINDIEELKHVVEMGTMFLIQGTLKSTVPHKEVLDVRSKNRRLGLGLMGIHEWLIRRGYKYEVVNELRQWLSVYRYVSNTTANRYCHMLNISTPVACRAIAPTGTIGIIGETTTGIEPIFARAYQRRYLKNGMTWSHQYVVDPTFKKVVEEGGIDPESVQDAYSLKFEDRIKFQADVQEYVDMGISSTTNLPAWGSPTNNEDTVKTYGTTLLKHLKHLRGITAYPDGARGGQPLVPVDPKEALAKEGTVFDYNENTCKGGVCGI